MTEEEYIAITNSTRIECALSNLQRVLTTDKEIKQAIEMLHRKSNELDREYTIISKA